MRIAGITGGSGAGKTTLAEGIRDRRGPSRVSLLPADAYYRDLSPLPPAERALRNFDDPAALDLALLAGHLEALRAGRPVRPPAYDMRTHTRRGEGPPVLPAPLLVVEGLFLTAEPRVEAALDLLVFVELPEAVRRERRIARDVKERGRSRDEVIRRWEARVLPAHERYVAPARERADLVVSGDDPAAVDRVLEALRDLA